ncbi:MAG TPA: metallophosphoesterase [Thermoanaerobaculia bacterium]|nr:metallophosphoesterase [Thermoanaerobaculia bacterium]
MMSFRRARLLAGAVVLYLAALRGWAAPRVVAIADVHGDLPAFKAILAQAGLVDDAGAWAGGDAVLIQLGDLIDRGPAMRATLDYAMALERSAAERGGRAVFLLGNHEVMNMTGDLRYVAKENWAEFAGPDSEKRREDAWSAVAALRTRRAKQLGKPDPAVGPEAKQQWLDAHPPGYVEQREAFGPEGVYGKWLRGHAAIVLEQGSVFLHGGVASPEPLADIDRKIRDELATYDEDERTFVTQGLILPFFDLQETFAALHEVLDALDARDASRGTTSLTTEEGVRRTRYTRFLAWDEWAMNSPNGPLWFRGYAKWSDAEGRFQVPRILEALRAERLVVGHTVQQKGAIQVRFGGTVYEIDTGMLDGAFFPGGRASAVTLVGGTVTALYPGEPPQVISPPPGKKPAKAAAGR